MKFGLKPLSLLKYHRFKASSYRNHFSNQFLLHYQQVICYISTIHVTMAQWAGRQIPNPTFNTTGWLQRQLSLSSFRGQSLVPGTPGNLVLKSKMSHRGGCVALRQLNPSWVKHPKDLLCGEKPHYNCFTFNELEDILSRSFEFMSLFL